MSRYVYLSIDEENDDDMERVCSALSSKVRRDILRLVDEKSYSISEIAKKLEIPLSNAAFHVKHLEEAGMINVQEKPATRGVTKIVARSIDEISIKCRVTQSVSTTSTTQFHIPIGSFTDCKVAQTCGMASVESYIEADDTPGSFFSPRRVDAQIIWLADGYLEYKIPNYFLKNDKAIELTMSMELCSEVSNYRNDWESDITFWVNGKELCTWTSPGDFGGRRGRLNPRWWSDVSTQYGMLKMIRVNERGVYLDEHKKSSVNISELHLDENDYFTLRVGIKPGAEHAGGLNIFGEKFGDFEQAIVVKIEHQLKREG